MRVNSEQQAEVVARVVNEAMYSPKDRVRYAKIIADFNQLYHDLYRQTWCATTWKGINILKPPTDLWVYQEIIHRHQPDLIIETGTMRGGSAVFLDDMNKLMNPNGHVISIDIHPEHVNEKARESNVRFLSGSSIDASIVAEVKAHIAAYNHKTVMVILDSDHSEEHVTNELNTYAPLVTIGMPLIVEDTGNCDGARMAVERWLPQHPEFVVDYGCEKFMLTFSRGGFLEKAV